VSRTIVGVMPPRADAVSANANDADVWLPLSLDAGAADPAPVIAAIRAAASMLDREVAIPNVTLTGRLGNTLRCPRLHEAGFRIPFRVALRSAPRPVLWTF
jgi:hypothetical protein